MMWKMPERKSIKPELNLSVDVFITVLNEPVDLIRKTIYAAVNMDYPHKTYVLDDGNNKEIKNLAILLGAKYLSRSDNKDAKAGNLNNGLAHSKGDYIAVFDADHIPNRKFLTETLGFFKNNKVAFVQVPQEFYNINSFQHRFKEFFEEIWSEQAIFFRVIRNTLISLAVLYGALFIFTKVVHYPEPIAAIKLGLAPASKTPTLMPWHVIDPSDKPIALPVASEKMPAEIMYKGTSLAFNEFESLDTL